MFSPEICDHLKYYVYRLIDPRNGETFYIGKGTRNRVFQHIKGEKESTEHDELNDKILRIREIRISGFDVAHVIHRHGMDEKTAFEVEAALIDAYPEVTNIVSGYNADDRGVMHSKQIIARYQAEEIDFKHKVLMITVNHTVLEKESVYEAVRFAWILDPRKAQNAEYVLAVRQGMVIGVFITEKWMNAHPDNFPGKPERPKRWGFSGHAAADDISKLYLGKRLPESLRKRGSANPVKYSY